jgi:hypothetical protein
LAGGAVLHPRRRPDEQHHDYNFALALVGWIMGGLGHVDIIGSHIFRFEVLLPIVTPVT